ncbi:MAG: endonuclease/exonuclease/phosphatase family protein [Acidobacteriota bacterium]
MPIRSLLLGFLVVTATSCAGPEPPTEPDEPPEVLRLALFNIEELRTVALNDVDDDGVGRNRQLRAAAEIVARIAPDVLVVQEIDHDASAPDDPALNARRFADAYLEPAAERHGAPLAYPHAFAAPSNTGLASGQDLDGDGEIVTEEGSRGYGGDSFGFGTYRGQYAMAVLSRFPLQADRLRSFQRFLWQDLPGHHIPPGFYSEQALEVFRLSSKSHWDLPVVVGEGLVHLLISHPTPPAFDGDEDRNGRRNFDEIKLWVEYLDGSSALIDDNGRRGGKAHDEPFVVVGDLNARPDADGERYDGQTAIAQLLDHPALRDPSEILVSQGAEEHRREDRQSRGNSLEVAERADSAALPRTATAEFLGGSRVDYLLPSLELRVLDGGVFWPASSEDPEGHALAAEASDHRLLWLDLALP